MNQRTQMSSRPAWLAGEDRQHDRLPVDISITLDAPDREQQAMLVDLSAAGCRLRVTERLSLGAFIAVRLAADQHPKGWVAWSRGLEAGIDFAVPLADDLVAALTARAGPEADASR